MMREPYKRPRCTPLTSEEVSHIIAHNKKKELVTLRKLKKSRIYKVLNIFNVLCMFIYLELLFCYFGPCHYKICTAVNTITHYGPGNLFNKKPYVSDMDIYDSDGEIYKFIIDGHVNPQPKNMRYVIGKDFLLQKALKGCLNGSDEAYRVFSASPVLLLCMLMIFFSFFGFVMDLNERVYTLAGLSILNFLTLLAVISI